MPKEHSNDVIPQDLLKKYLMYARSEVHPKLQQDTQQHKLARVYTELRKEGVLV